MTDLLNAEFEDETGTVRRLRRDELLTYITVVSGAGNETTTRLIGWAGKVLAEHPDQRKALVEDPSLIPNAIEELLRFEPPAPYVGRYVAKDVELHGQTVPAGSAMLLLLGAANRDDRRCARRRAVRHPSQRRARTSPSATARTSASAPRSPAWRAAWRSTRCSSASRSGTSTGTGPGWPPTSTVRGWETLPLLVP